MKFEENPFHVLGVSSRQHRREVLVAAKESALAADERAVRDARSVLVHPIKRITAEVAWLPGVELDRVRELLGQLKSDPRRVRHNCGALPALAQANLLSEALIHLPTDVSAEELAQWIVSIAEIHDKIELVSTIESLNADRRAGAFPAITRSDVVESELESRRRHFRRAVETVLEREPVLSRADALAAAVESATSGSRHAPVLIDDLVDRFEDQQRSTLEDGQAKVAGLCERVLKSASEARSEGAMKVRLKDGSSRMVRYEDIFGPDEDAIRVHLKELIEMVYEWDRLAQPGQVNARSRGLRHDRSLAVAGMIRNLAITLHNEYGMSRASHELTGVLLTAFAEIDLVVETSKRDAETLAGMIRKHEEARKQWGVRNNVNRDQSPGCSWILILPILALAGVSYGIYDAVWNRTDSSSGNTRGASSSYSSRGAATELTPPTGGLKTSQPVTRPPRPVDQRPAQSPYVKPSVGTNQVLGVYQIRWCLRQDIRLEAIRSVVSSNYEVSRFNELVTDYNARCGSFQYRSGSLARARRYVESERDRIEADAISEFR